MREAGGELAIVCSRDSVLKVFTVTGLDRILTMYRSVDEAVSA
jgi:anti-anti-sigma factor